MQGIHHILGHALFDLIEQPHLGWVKRVVQIEHPAVHMIEALFRHDRTIGWRDIGCNRVALDNLPLPRLVSPDQITGTGRAYENAAKRCLHVDLGSNRHWALQTRRSFGRKRSCGTLWRIADPDPRGVATSGNAILAHT